MKNPVIILIFLILSCSNDDEFSSEKKIVIQLKGIDYDYKQNSLSEDLWLDSYKINLDFAAEHLSSYFWIIDNDTIRSIKPPNIGYGEHFVKLVLIDAYGDTLSHSIFARRNEPLKIELISPIDGFSDFSKTDHLEFRYKISGIDNWEQASSFVCVSTEEESLWEEDNFLQNNILEPPLADIYFWGVKVFMEPDSIFNSEIRKIWIKN